MSADHDGFLHALGKRVGNVAPVGASASFVARGELVWASRQSGAWEMRHPAIAGFPSRVSMTGQWRSWTGDRRGSGLPEPPQRGGPGE
jgi:hypothetical protein